MTSTLHKSISLAEFLKLPETKPASEFITVTQVFPWLKPTKIDISNYSNPILVVKINEPPSRRERQGEK